MRVCLLTDKPGHPLLAATASLLAGAGHSVTFLDPDAGTEAGIGLADVYLLKAHTPRAIALARELEARGARVVNSADATHLCQDRSRMADLALSAGLPMPRTRTLDALAEAGARGAAGIGFPCMVKSRHNRRGDLVARVDDEAGLRALAGAWPDEPVVIQEFMENSGWDHKLWVIGKEVFTGLRPAPEEAGTAAALSAPLVREVPGEWAALALRMGEIFRLEVYGIDLLDRRGEPVVVDVNAFPGIRGPLGAPAALAALVTPAG